MDTKSDKKSKKKSYLIYSVIALLLPLIAWYSFSKLNNSRSQKVVQEISTKDTLAEELSEEFLKAVVPTFDSTENYVMLSNETDLNVALDEQAGSGKRFVFAGRRINIAVTGVDSRMGARTRHADANHVLSLLIDSGKVEIYSVPRDTYADCGYDDTTGQNKLTVLRAAKGRQAYLNELASITRLDKIHYWVEFGFSQAMGLIEFLGYSDAPSTLQVLRSRRGLGGDDYQRVYNQAQFIKQAVVKNFARFDGAVGSLLMRGVLGIVETNLNYQTASDLFEQMKNKSFPSGSSDVAIYIRPPMPIKFKVYDFQDKETFAELRRKIENFNQHRLEKYEEELSPNINPANILGKAIAGAAKDTARNPTAAINRLKVLYEQRAWFQVRDIDERIRIRDEITAILIHSYRKKKQFELADEVNRVIENENAVFKYDSRLNKANIQDTNKLVQ